MDRYPSPLEPTRATGPRRLAEWCLSAGAGGFLALLIAGGTVQDYLWWVVGALTVGGLAYLVCDELRLKRIDARAWTTDQWNRLRRREYKRRQGVFLTYTLTPTTPPSPEDTRTWWLLKVQLAQHRQGPLSDGEIKEVEYAFGGQFTEPRAFSSNPEESFCFEVKLYDSVLVLGRVSLTDRGERPLFVEQYVRVPEQAPQLHDAS